MGIIQEPSFKIPLKQTKTFSLNIRMCARKFISVTCITLTCNILNLSEIKTDANSYPRSLFFVLVCESKHVFKFGYLSVHSLASPWWFPMCRWGTGNWRCKSSQVVLFVHLGLCSSLSSISLSSFPLLCALDNLLCSKLLSPSVLLFLP